MNYFIATLLACNLVFSILNYLAVGLLLRYTAVQIKAQNVAKQFEEMYEEHNIKGNS